MYHVTLYASNGNWMREWRVDSYDWTMDHRALKFYLEEEDKEIFVMGGIVIIERKHEKEAHS